MKVITNWSVLIQLAKKESLAKNKHNRNPNDETRKEMIEAQKRHENYKRDCLNSDEMIIPRTSYG